jgi:hypothetical protein
VCLSPLRFTHHLGHDRAVLTARARRGQHGLAVIAGIRGAALRRPHPCCNWCVTDGALKAGTGSTTPSSMSSTTDTAAMVPAPWPRTNLSLALAKALN